jgi:predicted Zn finger-like uncharacterized protein
MAFQVTQCPHCESTFHTNPRILEMAAGRVRCGACLTVFLAEDNFLSQPEQDIDDIEEESVFIGNEPGEFFDPSVFISRTALKSELADSVTTQIEAPMSAEPSREEQLPEPEPGPEQTVFELPDPPQAAPAQEEEVFSEPVLNPESLAPENDDSAIETDEHQEFFAAIDSSLGPYGEADDISDLEEIAAMEPLSHQATPQQPGSETSNSASENPDNNGDTQAESWSDNTSLSVSLSMDLSQAETTAPATVGADESLSPEQDTTQSAATHADDDLEEMVKQAIAEQDFTAAVETGMQEPEQHTKPAEEALEDRAFDQHSDDLEHAEAADAAEEVLADDSDPEMSSEAIRARALQQELRDEDALDEIPAEHLASLKKIATPLELSGARQRSWGSRIGMLTLMLLLSAALVGQYLWRYRDSYSVDPRFRTAYELVCDQFQAITMLTCDLPQYSEIGAIRSDNLAVRSHPQREDGLMVTVELRNTASFPQQFPVLILGFNSASNEVIALREFAPEEYLDPGLRQFELMPVASPVQVSLPIMDPGEDAINYTLAFRAR